MAYEASYDIRSEDGAIIIPDLDCRIVASLDWDNGEPIVSVDDILVRDWRGNDAYVSILPSTDPLCQWVAHRIIEQAEDDADLIVDLMDGDGVSYRGRGGNDPDGRLVQVAS